MTKTAAQMAVDKLGIPGLILSAAASVMGTSFWLTDYINAKRNLVLGIGQPGGLSPLSKTQAWVVFSDMLSSCVAVIFLMVVLLFISRMLPILVEKPLEELTKCFRNTILVVWIVAALALLITGIVDVCAVVDAIPKLPD